MNKLENVNNLVSVIVPVFNEEKVIGRLLHSIQEQSHKAVEIIVVDDASIDNTSAEAKRYTNNVFIRSHAERSVQRNFGAKKARGKYFLFLDADMELSRNVILECLRTIHGDNNIGAIAIPEESIASTFWEKVKAFERSLYNEHGDLSTDAARFFKKDVFEKVGGYDEGITGPEDWDLPERILKAGYKQERIKSKIYHFERVPDPIKLAKKKYYYALRSYRYFNKHNISALGPKTVYFLRPVFYQNWRKLIRNPGLTFAMFLMLTCEQIGGGIGYIIGRMKNL